MHHCVFVCRFSGAQLSCATISVTVLCLGFMAYHIMYLSLVKFDYGYNMKANILIGKPSDLRRAVAANA